MERVEADKLSKRTSTKVWNVQAFCRRQNLCQKEGMALDPPLRPVRHSQRAPAQRQARS